MTRSVVRSALSAALLLPFGAPVAAEYATTVRIVEGLERPIHLTAPAGDPRLFVCEQILGQILVYKDGAFLPTPFLDIGHKITTDKNAMGLLGLAFHPQYDTNGYFYIVYSQLDWTTTVSRFQVSATDPDVADPASELVLLTQEQPQDIHNGGGIAFSPADGYLYLSFGDGGWANDWGCNAQNPGTWLGKFLRIDVDSGSPYAVPPDNPFVGVAGALPEIWSVGWRNPWRFGFDSGTGDLYVGDVGQYTREEISYERTGAGGRNYGWKLEEGSQCGLADPSDCEPFGGLACGDPTLVAPVHDYSHLTGSCSVIGGTVYRGSDIPDLNGRYFFGDYCSGKIFSFTMLAGQAVNVIDHSEGFDPPEFGVDIAVITHLGTDGFGELYIIDRSGEIFRMVAAEHISADVPEISIAAGGTQLMSLDGMIPQAGLVYAVLGSVTGSEPGVPIPPYHLPLNFDEYTLHTLTLPNQPPLLNTVGILNGHGDATAAFSAPAGVLPTAAVGLTAHHAFVVLDGSTVVGVSNATSLEFAP